MTELPFGEATAGTAAAFRAGACPAAPVGADPAHPGRRLPLPQRPRRSYRAAGRRAARRRDGLRRPRALRRDQARRRARLAGPARLTRLVESSSSAAPAAVITTNVSRAAVLAERYPRAEIVSVGNVPHSSRTSSRSIPGSRGASRCSSTRAGSTPRRAPSRRRSAPWRYARGPPRIVGFGRDRDLRLIGEWAARDEGRRARPPLRAGAVRRSRPGRRRGDGRDRAAAEHQHELLPRRHEQAVRVHDGRAARGRQRLPRGRSRPRRRATRAAGETFDPESPASIAAAVGEVLSDRYDQRRERARELAVGEHNWRHEERKLIDCFPALAAEQGESGWPDLLRRTASCAPRRGLS